jgi:hypothetical protein
MTHSLAPEAVIVCILPFDFDVRNLAALNCLELQANKHLQSP